MHLGYYALFWVIGVFLAALRKIFAGAPCCLVLVSWSLSSQSVLALVCCCLLGHAFAPWSMEFVLNLNSSWLYCLLLLTLACFGLLLLAVACFALLCLLWLLALSVPLLLRLGDLWI